MRLALSPSTLGALTGAWVAVCLALVGLGPADDGLGAVGLTVALPLDEVPPSEVLGSRPLRAGAMRLDAYSLPAGDPVATAWSPDGRTLAIKVQGPSEPGLYMVEPHDDLGSVVTTAADLPDGAFPEGELAWLRDSGGVLMVAEQARQLLVAPVRGGAAHRVHPLQLYGHAHLAWLAWDADPSPSLYLVGLQSGRRQRLAPAETNQLVLVDVSAVAEMQ